MKNFQFKVPALLLVIFFFTVLGFSNCGQNENTKKDSVVTEPLKTEIPVVATDSQVSVPVTPINIEEQTNTQPGVKTDTKKEIVPAGKTNVQEPDKKPTVVQPVIANKNPVPNTNVTPSVDKPIVPSKETPVVKVPEPVKPTAVTQPKVEEVPKPVVVDKPQPAQGSWIVPEKYKNMKSPFAVDKDAMDLGRTVYGTHCKSCHGAKAMERGLKPLNLTQK